MHIVHTEMSKPEITISEALRVSGPVSKHTEQAATNDSHSCDSVDIPNLAQHCYEWSIEYPQIQ